MVAAMVVAFLSTFPPLLAFCLGGALQAPVPALLLLFGPLSENGDSKCSGNKSSHPDLIRLFLYKSMAAEGFSGEKGEAKCIFYDRFDSRDLFVC